MESRDDTNPYAAPVSSSQWYRSGPLEAPPPAAGSSFSVDHDLEDRDLRRWLGFDAFYDPLPLLGFVPQWLVLVAILVALGSGSTWSRTRSLPLAAALGPAGAFAGLGYLMRQSALYRRVAREAGYCDGRRVTISVAGVRVIIATHPDVDFHRLGEGIHPWREFRRVEFREDYLFLWMQGRARLVIPVKAFRSTGEVEAFALAAAGWIGSTR